MSAWDRAIIIRMRRWGIPVLRVVLGIVFVWFGALKLFGVSPVGPLIQEAYGFLPYHQFVLGLGVGEILIGLGLIGKVYLRATLALLWLQMLGTFMALVLAPWYFFTHGNILLLTMAGEFVIKNLVLVAAGIVIGGHEVK